MRLFINEKPHDFKLKNNTLTFDIDIEIRDGYKLYEFIPKGIKPTSAPKHPPLSFAERGMIK